MREREEGENGERVVKRLGEGHHYFSVGRRKPTGHCG